MANAGTEWLIYTDLDGTLLNHHDYDFTAAVETLNKLQQQGIPVIINTSKTAAEVLPIREALNNKSPFIVENGSGVLLPRTDGEAPPEDAKVWGNYWEVVLGTPRQTLLTGLAKVPAAFTFAYQSYNESTVSDVMLMTGLSHQEALASMDRRYTEPLHWLANTEQKRTFFAALDKQKIPYTEGGRFIHLMGRTNKGKAMQWLQNHYAKQYSQPIRTLALGDANNDIDMLVAADIAAVIKSPVAPAPRFAHKHKVLSTNTGAAGWSEVIEKIIFNNE